MRTKIIKAQNNIALEASAGSGKTFALSLRVVNLLLDGIDPERILCVTFTNKATNEMYQRIIRLIRYLAFELSPSNIKEEARYILNSQRGKEIDNANTVSFTDDEIKDLRNRAEVIYEQVVRNISKLRISTIDSFLNSILRLFPFESGVMPDFSILTPVLHDTLYMDAFEHFVSYLETDRFLRNMVSELIRKSYKAVSSPATFLHNYFERLIEMRIGTEHVIREMLACVEEGEWSQCINDISGSLKRAGELDVAIRVKAKSFAKLLRETCQNVSAPGLGQIEKYETSHAAEIASLKSIEKDYYSDYRYFKKCDPDKSAQSLFEKIKKDLNLFVHLRNKVYRDAILYLFSLFVVELDKVKKQEKGLTFSDVTNTCYNLLVDQGMIEQSADYFYFRIDSRIDHFLIDEFQDTNVIQWLIIKPFVDELTAGIGQKERQGSFFYVGDPKQSIYRFRGGESMLFDKVLEQYQGKIDREVLDTNYRSARTIVDFVNELFSRISDDYDMHYEPQKAYREDEGFVEVIFFDKEEARNNPDVKKEQVILWLNQLQEKGISHRDIAILCNDNRQCENYAEFLMLNNIPAVTEGSLSILSSPGVDAVIELLRFFQDPGQDVYLLSFLFSVPGLLTKRQKQILLSMRKSNHVPKDIREKIDKIIRRVNLFPVAHIIRMIIDAFELYARFEEDPNMLLLIDIAASNEIDNPCAVGVFLDCVETTIRDVKAIQTESVDSVKVLTIHKAKGLEFPYVIVPELEIDISVNARDTQLIFERDEDLFVRNIYLNENREILSFHPELAQAVQKERELTVRDRLNQLYVALTRAEEGLFVTALIKEEKKNKATGTLRVSEVLSDSLGREGYCRGSVPACPSLPEDMKVQASSGTRLDDVLDYISSHKKQPAVVEESEEEHETISFENYRARRIGVAFHYAVEVLRAFQDHAIEESIRKVKQVYGSELTPEEVSSIRKRLSLLVRDTEFNELIKERQIEKEITFVTGKNVSVADLIAVGEEQVRVIDLKTNYEEDLIDRYTKQVRNYCRSASNIYSLPCQGYLCFVLEEAVKCLEV